MEPVTSAPKARIRVAARARETPMRFEVAAGEQRPVERLELLDGVGEGEEPLGSGWHFKGRSTLLLAWWLGGWRGQHVFGHVRRRSSRIPPTRRARRFGGR